MKNIIAIDQNYFVLDMIASHSALKITYRGKGPRNKSSSAAESRIHYWHRKYREAVDTERFCERTSQ